MPSARRPLALLGLAGAGAALSACSAAPGPVDTSAEYADGVYTAVGRYQAPSGSEEVEVTITLEDDLVTDVTVTARAVDPTAQSFQSRFASGIADLVEGRDIDTLDVSRVAGSSLTSGGFAAALETIRAQALEG